MPYEHGRTKNISAHRRIRSASRRLVDQHDYKSCPKELQLLELESRVSEQRLPSFTIIFIDSHASKKVLPFPSPLPDAYRQNKFESICFYNMHSPSPQSPQMFEVDLQARYTDSTRLNSSCISSEASSLGQYESSTKSSNSLDSSSSSSPPGCLISGNSSGSVCDDLSALGSDFLVNDIPKVEKRVKRNPRKKGKKKGKQSKRTAFGKVSTESNVQCDGNIYASAFETSSRSCLSSSSKNLLHNKLSDKETPPSLLVTDITEEKYDGANNVEFVDCSTNPSSCTSCSNERDNFELLSLPQIFAGDKSCCNTTTYLNPSSTHRDAGMVPFTLDGSTKEDHSKENNIFHDNLSSISMDNYNSLDGSNSDIGENSSDDSTSQLLAKDASGPSSSEVEIISPSGELVKCDTSSDPITVNLCNMDTEMSENCYSSDAYLSNNVIDACSSTERADCSNQAGSSNDFHPVTKRGRRAKKMIVDGNLSGANRSVNENIHSHMGKDNNYSIWQKVQKIERKEGVSKPNNVSISPRSEVSFKDTKTKMKLDKFVGLKQNQCGINNRYSCLDEFPNIKPSQVASSGPKTSQALAKSTSGNAVNSVKSKSSSAVKEVNQYHRCGSYTGKSDIHKASKNHVQQKEALQNSPLTNLNKHSSTGLRLSSNGFSQRCLAKLTDSIDCLQSGLEKEIHVPVEEATPLRNSSNGVCHMSLPTAFSETGQMPTTLNQFGQRHIDANCESGTAKYSKDMKEDLPNVGIQDYRCIKPDMESYRESSSLLSNTGTSIQKWIPVGGKDSIVLDKGYLDCLKAPVIDETALNQSCPDVSEVEVLSSNNSSFTPKDGGVSYPGANKLTNKSSSYPHSAEVCDLHAAISCQTHEMKDEESIGFKTDLEKIMRAVNDAYKLQTAAEGVQLVTGSPVADFEKFLFSASPVIGQTQCSRSCNSCSRERLKGDSLCWRQIPNISLKSIWQWYEEPGCFGLEVKAHDYCNSRRPWSGHCEFTAYFVPYLSAVQLFGKSRKTRYCDLSGEAGINCEVDKTTKSLPSLGSLPILSLLLPQPRKDTGACFSESSCFAKDEFDKSIHVGHEQLIFEYFESDQPPQRRPLYEKIKELVAGETLSDSYIFGDPLELESIKLHDLHPASWYCVAWYPIYRIPDGNFRAAFLTYHSLGHFVNRSAPASTLGAFTTVVSPVVGLQTYNDKGEKWFQPREMDLKVVQCENALYSNTSELMKERLRTLKQTASMMARAAVPKGNQRSVNRHPDYEFFVSRSW